MNKVKGNKNVWISKDEKYMIVKYSSRDYSVYEKDEDGMWQYQMSWPRLKDAKFGLD